MLDYLSLAGMQSSPTVGLARYGKVIGLVDKDFLSVFFFFCPIKLLTRAHKSTYTWLQ